MTIRIEAILENLNFTKLRRACIQKIRSLDSTLPNSLIPKIQSTTSLDDMLDVLSESPYWNCFDTRLLQALVSASGSPEAEQLLESFKATFYTKKVVEVIPYICIKPFKESISLVEKFDKNPKDLTISDLLEHKYKLEHEVLDIDEGGLVLICIRTGCVELTWQIQQKLVYQAYVSVKRNHNKLSTLAVESLVCKEADKFVDLPISWYRQEVVESIHVHSLPEQSIQEPYTLFQGWMTLSNITLAAELLSRYHITGLANMMYWCQLMIDFHVTLANRSDWHFCIHTSGSQLVDNIILSNSPRKPGWGRMTSEDILSELAFINKWSTQFEVSHVIHGEEIICHDFL